jgi:hypothetical protein
MLSRLISLVLILACICLASGCGDDKGTEVVSPEVTQTYPEDGAVDVSLYTGVSIWFSRDMDEASLDSIYIGDMTTQYAQYSASEKMVTVLPDSMLKPETLYEVRVVSYVMDTDGNNLAEDYTFGFTTGPFDCAHIQDRFEPNDDIATATPVELNTTYRLLSTCGAEERRDLFRFTVDDTVMVTARTDISYCDTIKISFLEEFLRSDGEALSSAGTSISPPSSITWHYSFLPGTYHYSIGKYHPDQYTAPYSLTLETSEPCRDDVYEDNDLFDEAAVLTPGSYSGLRGCKTDQDYYSLELIEGQVLTVTYNQTSAPQVLRRLTIYDVEQRELLRRQESASPTVGTINIPSTGTYYIGFFFWSDDIAYDLDIEVTGP